MPIPSLNDYRKNQGRKAKAFGDLFESMFKYTCHKLGIAITVIPPGCKSMGGTRIIRVKSPFDWICTYQGKTALIDTKTCIGNAFPHSQISDHQIHELVHHQISGAIAGYVIWLRKSDRIIFLDALTLEKRAQKPGSINDELPEARSLGNGKSFDPTQMFI